MEKEKKVNKAQLIDELNNLEYNYEKEFISEFTLNLVANCFVNLLLITGQDAEKVIKEYIDDWRNFREKGLVVEVDNMYEAIKERKLQHTVGKQAHLEHAMKALNVAMESIELNFNNITSSVTTKSGIEIVSDISKIRKPS